MQARKVVVRRAPDKDMLDEFRSRLHTIAENKRKLAKLVAQVTEDEDALFADMQAAKVQSVSHEGDAAEVVVKMGNASNVIPPDLLFATMKGDAKDFFSCVRVVKAEAQKYLSGKELDSITRTTPGAPKPPELIITLRK